LNGKESSILKPLFALFSLGNMVEPEPWTNPEFYQKYTPKPAKPRKSAQSAFTAGAGRTPAARNQAFITRFGGDGSFVPDTTFQGQYVDDQTYAAWLAAYRQKYGRDPKNPLKMERVVDKRDPRGYDWYAYKDKNGNGKFDADVDTLKFIDGVGVSRWNATTKQQFTKAKAAAGWADEDGYTKLKFQDWKKDPAVKAMRKGARNTTAMDLIRELVKPVYDEMVQDKTARRKYSLLEASADVLKAVKEQFEPGFFQMYPVAPEGEEGSEQSKLHNRQVRKLRASQEYFDGISQLIERLTPQGISQIIRTRGTAAQGRPLPPPRAAAKQPAARQATLDEMGLRTARRRAAPPPAQPAPAAPPGQIVIPDDVDEGQ
jgi:hypothetical protein